VDKAKKNYPNAINHVNNIIPFLFPIILSMRIPPKKGNTKLGILYIV